MSYALTKQLPSCVVERKLLVELENYLQRKVKDFAPPGKESWQPDYSIVIVDSSGSETLTGIEGFKRTYFPDDIQRITLKCGSAYRHNLSIEISFHVFQQLSTLNLWFDGSSAREVANGIAAEIFSILESYKTSNRFFHSYYSAPIGIIINLTLLAPPWMYLSTKLSNLNLLVVAIIYAISGMLLGVVTPALVRHFKPYSTFETRRNERLRKQLSWILLGLLGYILFTVIGVYFRLKIFGF